MAVLGRLKIAGTFVRQDVNEGEKWLRKAVNNLHHQQCMRLPNTF